jgi:ketopantoate reductase
MMIEVRAVGAKLSASRRFDVERRLDVGGGVGVHRTSMLQDLECGRPMEIAFIATGPEGLARVRPARTDASLP